MKNHSLLFLVLLGLTLLCCNNKTGTQAVVLSDEKVTVAYKWEDNFELDMANFWVKQLASEERAIITQDPLDKNNDVLKITLGPSDKVNGGIRSEFVIKQLDSLGYLNSYSFRFMLPDSFFKEQDKNGWYLIHQWHDEPSPGFTWATRKHKTKPPIALTISYTPQNGYVLYYKDGLETGDLKDAKRLFWPETLKPNLWYTFSNAVFWSLYDTHGYSEPRLNGLLFESEKNSSDLDAAQIIGRNMYNAKGNYFKFGLYQGSGETHTRHIYIDDFYMETKRAAYWFE